MTAGMVFLVGAGPGDPGLITIKGLRCIQSADVVLFDRLVNKALLSHARPDAELIDVGKVRGQGGGHQAQINTLLVDKAKLGGNVVRLKGGDPFVFGRGGEEAEALRRQGIPFEVVPGVTSAIAAPAYAGIPLTHRGLTSSLSVVTGNEDPSKPDSFVAWDKLAQAGGTLVVLMGWENLPAIVQALMNHGRAADTPVALVQWGTELYQKTVVGTLSDIVDRASHEELSPPVAVVVGEVVSLRARLRWFDNRPLFGKRVLVTRTRAQAGTLSRRLSERGAQAIELPTIEIKPAHDLGRLDSALGDLSSYAWVIFTSANAVRIVFDRLAALDLDARAFNTAKVAAIGPATGSALRERGVAADFVPERFVSEAVVSGLKHHGVDGGRVLLPRADIAPESLSRGLASIGAEVDEVIAYRTVAPEACAAAAGEILSSGIDIATFTSSSTVRNLVSALGDGPRRLSTAAIACIGPVTAATARELGLKVDIVAEEHTVDGLVNALEAFYTKEGDTDE